MAMFGGRGFTKKNELISDDRIRFEFISFIRVTNKSVDTQRL
jgi:hypothetical protein